MQIVYDCHVREVMGYPQRGYCFRRGDDALLMGDGYFSDIMHAMWRIYGWESDPDEPDQPNLLQVPFLREWNAHGVGTHGPIQIAELATTAQAFRCAVAELRRTGSHLAESPQHGEALADFFEQAVGTDQSVSIEEWWG
jgi:hypothetical protein